MSPTAVIFLWTVCWTVSLLPNVQSELYSQSPNLKATLTTKGMVIDAGSGGSRLHIYSWKPRIFDSLPPPISYPEANELWTGRMDPGIATYFNTPELVSAHLAPLIDFAKVTLGGQEEFFSNYPIYFKATGGMRELELRQREEILRYVRIYLSDKTFCPFYFRNDFARVISGEEEAIFSWAATNFLLGTLLPESQGTGMVVGVNKTYGTLDLGGASTQIAFYVPSQDINEGLYNLQIGGQKHWNVYTKSFLQFGIVSARLRHMTELVDQSIATKHHALALPVVTKIDNSTHVSVRQKNNTPTGQPTGSSVNSGSGSVVNVCFHSGYSETATDSTGQVSADLSGPDAPKTNQLALCMQSLKGLMEKKYGKFCDQVYHGDCSIAGAYQPPVPDEQHGHFIGQSSYKYPWKFMQLPQTASLELFKAKAEDICAMSFADVLNYYQTHNLALDPNKLDAYLPYYCFLSSYVLVLLQDGYRFKLNQTLTVLDDINGHSVGWALGSILYEINQMPWELRLSPIDSHPWAFVMVASILGFLVGSVAAVCIYKEIVEEKRAGQRPPQDYDYESLSRVPTMELMEMNPQSAAAGAKFTNFGNMHSAPGSPSTTTIRKTALTSPYTSPSKGFKPPLTNNSSNSSGLGSGSSSSSSGLGIAESGGLFKNMIDNRPFQQQARHKYESVSDRES